MHFSEYQKMSLNTWIGEERLVRSFLGVSGETGELSENIKKYLRGDYDFEELKKRAFKEIGDILYYLAICDCRCRARGRKRRLISRVNHRSTCHRIGQLANLYSANRLDRELI